MARRQVVTFRATEEQIAQIEAAAKARGVSKTDLILERVLGKKEEVRRPLPGKAYRACRFHPDAGAVLVNRRWFCKHPNCPEVLS